MKICGSNEGEMLTNDDGPLRSIAWHSCLNIMSKDVGEKQEQRRVRENKTYEGLDRRTERVKGVERCGKIHTE